MYFIKNSITQKNIFFNRSEAFYCFKKKKFIIIYEYYRKFLANELLL